MLRYTFFLIVLILSLTSCRDDGETIEVKNQALKPTQASVDVPYDAGPCESYIVLGRQSVIVDFGKMDDALQVQVKEVNVKNLPIETIEVSAALSGFLVSFTEVDFYEQNQDELTYEITGGKDHNLGVIATDVKVMSVSNGVANLRVQLTLSDKNFDDEWWGIVKLELIFLGCHPQI